MGLALVVAPLFEVRAVEWSPPDPGQVDSILLTSANGARCAGPGLEAFRALPCYAVGEATAEAARSVGFRQIVVGNDDGAALLGMVAAAGSARPLHLCGREHIALEQRGLTITRRIVYAAESVPRLPEEAEEALRKGAVALVHSARAASCFAALVDEAEIGRERISVAAISQAAASAAGTGWSRVEAAAYPADEALLELAAKLCKTARSETGNGG